MRPHFTGENFGLVKFVLRGEIEQRVVGDTAPEEERQPRGQLEIADTISFTGLRGFVFDFGAINERWRREDSPEGELDSGIEKLPAFRRSDRTTSAHPFQPAERFRRHAR